MKKMIASMLIKLKVTYIFVYNFLVILFDMHIGLSEKAVSELMFICIVKVLEKKFYYCVRTRCQSDKH